MPRHPNARQPIMTTKTALVALALWTLTPIPSPALQPHITNLWAFPTAEAILSSPALSPNGTIYFGAYDRILHALNPDGTEKWAFRLPTPRVNTNGVFTGIFSSPALGPDGSIYFGAEDQYLYSLHPETGKANWAFLTGDAIYSDPAIGPDGAIYVGSYDTNLYAINPDGTEKWRFQAGDQIFSDPVLGPDGSIYFGCDDGKLYALNPDGSKKWDFSPAPGAKGIIASPVIAGDGTLYHAVNWSPLACCRYRLYAVNPDGTKKWEFLTGREMWSSPALGPDGTIYIGSGALSGTNGKLYALNPDGTQKWAFVATNTTFRSSPAIASDGTILVGADSGLLYAFDPAGNVLWTFLAADAIYSSPAIAPDGTIYFGSGPADGQLYALPSRHALATTIWPMFRKNLVHTGTTLPPPAITPSLLSDGRFQLTLTLEPGRNYQIDLSPDLRTWEPFTNLLGLSTATTNIVDPNTALYPRRFYRAWAP